MRTETLIFDKQLHWPVYSLNNMTKACKDNHLLALSLDCGTPDIEPRLGIGDGMKRVVLVDIKSSEEDQKTQVDPGIASMLVAPQNDRMRELLAAYLQDEDDNEECCKCHFKPFLKVNTIKETLFVMQRAHSELCSKPI